MLMILLDVFGNIQPTIVSEKLCLKIRNPYGDWKSGFYEDIKQQEKISKLYKTNTKFNVLAFAKFFGRFNNDADPYKRIVNNLIGLEVSNINKSMLNKKNRYIDSPTCETPYAIKFVNFCNVVQAAKSRGAQYEFNCHVISGQESIYNSESKILNSLSHRIERFGGSSIRQKEHRQIAIENLCLIGRMIDNFLETEDDFWLFDHILNSVSIFQEDNLYHIFKVMALIEMLLVNPKTTRNTTSELRVKIINFLPEYIKCNNPTVCADILCSLRNKIAHGDIRSSKKLLYEFKSNYMKTFWFDLYEFSEENWIIGNICSIVNEILSEVLWIMISDKPKFNSIKNNCS